VFYALQGFLCSDCKGDFLMKHITIADSTLCKKGNPYSFKEKTEIARQLEKLNVDVIELPEIQNTKSDILFVRTAASFVKNSIISVAAGLSAQSIEDAASALTNAAKPRIRIELPVSTVGMEYTCHKKAEQMLSWIKTAISSAKEKCVDVVGLLQEKITVEVIKV
jgi:2-isopropylmalate synthase